MTMAVTVAAVGQGLSYKVIAERLFISFDTVNNHIRAIYKKLQVRSKGELLALTLGRRGPGEI